MPQILVGAFCNWGTIFWNDSILCQVGIDLTSTLAVYWPTWVIVTLGGGRDRQISGVHWPASQVSIKDCLKYKVESDCRINRMSTSSSACAHSMDEHSYAYTHVTQTHIWSGKRKTPWTPRITYRGNHEMTVFDLVLEGRVGTQYTETVSEIRKSKIRTCLGEVLIQILCSADK